MGFFDWNKDAERRVIELTNNFKHKVKVKKFQYGNKPRYYMEISQCNDFNKCTRFSIYEDEMQSVLDYLSEKYNEKINLSPKRNEMKKSK